MLIQKEPKDSKTSVLLQVAAYDEVQTNIQEESSANEEPVDQPVPDVSDPDPVLLPGPLEIIIPPTMMLTPSVSSTSSSYSWASYGSELVRTISMI